MENYKEDVLKSRVGCLGSSDGKMLAQICSLGYVPKSAYKRLAVCNGLVEQEEIPKTAAVAAGDEMEMLIYKHLSNEDPRFESNPLWVSKKYSMPNVSLISHPDLVLKDDEKKTLFVYEVKTTKYSIDETRNTYKSQLFIHYLLGKEIIESLGRSWKLKLFLVHYDTNGLDLQSLLENGNLGIDLERLSVKEVRFTSSGYFDIKLAMSIVSSFLETFTEYYDGEEIDADLLPQEVKSQFEHATALLNEINQREDEIKNFKAKLYDFMLAKNIKSMKNDKWCIVRVDDTESKSFDHKAFLEDYTQKHPRKAEKLKKKYTKTTKRKGYCTIKLKNKD